RMMPAQPHDWWRRRPVRDHSDQSPAARAQRRTPADSSLAFWSMVGFTGILLRAPQVHFPVLIPFRIALCAAVISLVAYVSHRMSRDEPILVMSREIRVALGLAGWAVLTIPLG